MGDVVVTSKGRAVSSVSRPVCSRLSLPPLKAVAQRGESGKGVKPARAGPWQASSTLRAYSSVPSDVGGVAVGERRDVNFQQVGTQAAQFVRHVQGKTEIDAAEPFGWRFGYGDAQT